MMRILRSIPEWGIDSTTSGDQANHYRLTNVLLAFMCMGSIVWTTVLFATGAVEAAIINSTAPFVFGGGLLLMRAGYTILARVFVITIAYSAGYAVCTIVGRESYFQLIFLFSSGFSLAFFSLEEKWLLAYGIVAALCCFGLLEYTDYAPIAGLQRAEIAPTSLTYMRYLSMMIVWGLMSAHFAYFVSRRRRTQMQLVSASKMVAMGRMAAGIAHEVNNPLQRIVGHADRLKIMAASGKVTPEQLTALSEQIQVVAMRIASIVKGLLALSRDASNDPFNDVPLSNVMRLSLDYCRARLESYQVDLRIEDIPSHWTIVGREAQLSEVLLNVLSNAFDAAMDSTERWIRIEVQSTGPMIEIAVTDSGAGVKPDVQHRIFDPFFTTKPVGKGTGLGLSVSQAIMAAHGGQILLDPTSERTRFVIRVPRGADLERPTIQSLDV